MELDHIAIAGETLAAATEHCEASLGVPFQKGGEHAVYGTHNTLLGVLDGLYVEAIAVNPEAQPQRSPRWFDLDRFSGRARVTNWICRCKNLDTILEALPEGFGQPVSLQRGDLRWRMAVPVDGVLPFDGCAPALIEWEDELHPSEMLDTAPLQMNELTISHPNAHSLGAMLQPFLSDERLRFVEGDRNIKAEFVLNGEIRAVS